MQEERSQEGERQDNCPIRGELSPGDRVMADCTPKGVLSRQTLQSQPSITKTPILKREDDQNKTELHLTIRVNTHEG